MKKTIALIAVAGLASLAAAQATIHMTADKTTAVQGEAVTWTMTLNFTSANADAYVFGLNLQAMSSLAGTASQVTAGTHPAGVTFFGGDVTGASIDTINYADAFGSQFGRVGADNPFVIGTFTVSYSADGQASYSVDKKSVGASPAITIGSGGAFAPPFLTEDYQDASAFTTVSDSVTITPTPASLALVGLGGLVATRRRR